jgi:hypothetical protein
MDIKKKSNSSPVGLLVNAPRSREYGTKGETEFERTTIQIPVDTMRRFNEKTKGGKGVCITALLDFAMDTLEQNNEVIVIN